jgi:short-subunit dehydrogenase
MANRNLKDEVVVITGASSGFGRGAARDFAASGASVVLAARRGELLEELVAECEQAGSRAISVPTDVAEPGEVEELARAAVSAFGGFDVWVNNAGAGALGRFEEIPIEDHIKVVRTTLLGTLYGSYQAMRRFREQGSGTLINVASIAGKVPHAYYSSYAASKHGVVGLSAVLRQELEENGVDSIHVCTVLPGAHDTPFFVHAANYTGHEATPPPPVYDPQDVVDVIVRLATHPQDEVTVGGAAKMMAFTHSIAPDTTEKVMGKEAHKTQMEKAPPAPPTPGSLREPSPQGRTMRGGWRKKEPKPSRARRRPDARP